ncbi:MAG: hypothetical protein JWL77_7038 [Chthonomonadaceae bacterium]|nr:hypothetical protein [Chthonomonadaceae bacterium]
MHLNSKLVFETHVKHRIRAGSRVLELGADTAPSTYRRAVPVDVVWETADLVGESGRWAVDNAPAEHLMQSEYNVPVDDDSFDVVLSGQVAEHVREIWTWMRELARITKPGGQVITISPVSWAYHEAPIDCWRMYPEAMNAVSAWAGLEVEFSWWGSLEPRGRRHYQGEGRALHHREPRRALRRALGLATPVAYDLVTVARKPLCVDRRCD